MPFRTSGAGRERNVRGSKVMVFRLLGRLGMGRLVALGAPELNPVENIWQFIRQNWLSNRVFESYDQIVALCSHAWNKLIDQPWKIMSIGHRRWVNEF